VFADRHLTVRNSRKGEIVISAIRREPVLITGCSSGIGRAAAASLRCHQGGRMLPGRAYDAVIRRQYGLPG
jgi:short-subunit dehydrogenase